MSTSSNTALATITGIVRDHARDDDGSTFLRLLHAGSDDETLSYAELVEHAGRWSARFAADGLTPGDRVIVILRHSLDLYAAYIGALLGGHVPAMFSFPSPKYSEDRYFEHVGVLIASSGAREIVTYPELAEKLPQRERTSLGNARVTTPAHLQSVPVAPAPTAVDPEAAAFVQYSSGTTGIKKGVVVSHRALLWQLEAYADAIGAGPRDRIVSWLPLYHDMGLIACLFLPLVRKIPLVAMSPFDWVAQPAMWPRAISDYGGTLSWLPNFAYSFMAANVRDDELAGVDLSTLRGVVNCSEPVMRSSHEAFLARFGRHGMTEDRLAASYAMAENTFAVTSGGFGVQLREGHTVLSSGRPLPGVEVRIRGLAHGDGDDREIGEVVLRSPCLMDGYDGNQEATAEALRDGWHLTGDLGYLDGDDLFVTGRVKDLIIIGGRNVYPQDVEAAVHNAEGVIPGRAVAFGVPDERQGTESLVVVAETNESDTGRREEIRRLIHASVAELTEVVPGDILLVEPRTLHKSSSGKLARAANRELYLGMRQPHASMSKRASRGGATDLIDAVRVAVARVARVARVRDDESLLRSGLIDSFGMVELFAELEAATGVRLTADHLTELERMDTIAALANLVTDGAVRPAPSTLVLDSRDIPMAVGGPQPARRGQVGWWTRLYRAILRRHGVQFGPGLRVLGPIHLQLEGNGSHVSLGRNVTLMPGVHLKNREEGRIVLHDGAKLDSVVRLVAANDATIELGENAVFGMGTVVNAGADVRIGRNAFTASHCVIISSEHGLASGVPMREQPYTHSPVLIGEDVWLGANCLVSKGARIGHGAVVSAGSVVAGDVPPAAIVQGQPARVIKFRQ
ncbi:MAG: AMP-binding protein [Thermoleophilaceae bacterium]